MGIINNARELRKDQTVAERKLWSYLRNRRICGRKFRRQHPFKKYILDFYCDEIQLAVELDGSSHSGELNRQHDKERTDFLESCGIKVIRFYNSAVENDIYEVLSILRKHL
jgi:very-short-patch-repair endonuclease